MGNVDLPESNLLKKARGFNNDNAKRFYVNRAFGRNSYYSVIDGDIDALTGAG